MNVRQHSNIRLLAIASIAVAEWQSAIEPAEPSSAAPNGATPPARTYAFDSSGLRLAAYEWGDPQAPPILLAHGGGDFARTFDVFAPLLAARGFRVISWDQRGHGDSDPASLYGWDADARDALALVRVLDLTPVRLVGHSKGGMVATRLAVACPELVSHLVNIDGFPASDTPSPAPRDDMIEMRLDEMRRWLDRRREADLMRRATSPAELARRRRRFAPRVPMSWMQYLVSVGARHDPDGWRWKGDPAMSQLLSNPVRLDWPLAGCNQLRIPVLAVLGLVREMLHLGATVESAAPFLPVRAEVNTFADSGHFVHIEHPHRVASSVLDFLA